MATRYVRFDPNTNFSIESVYTDETLDSANGWHVLPLDTARSVDLKIDSNGIITLMTDEEIQNRSRSSLELILKDMIGIKANDIVDSVTWTQLPSSLERNGQAWVNSWKTYIDEVKAFPGTYDIANSDLTLANVTWPTPPSE